MAHSDAFPAANQAGLGSVIERQFETFCRAMVRGDKVTSEPGFVRLRTGEMHPLANFTVVSRPDDAAALDAATATLRDLAAPSAVVFAGEGSAAALKSLKSWGYALAETMPAMAVDLDRLAAATEPKGCRFEVIGVDRDGDWCDAFAAGYGVPRSVAACFGPAAASRSGTGGAIRHFAITRGGAIVSTSALFCEGGLAGIYAVATPEQERGQGLGACATARPLEIARAEGYRTGILQASQMGAPVYRRLGFESYGALSLFVRMPGA